jgi:hypothetical protein
VKDKIFRLYKATKDVSRETTAGLLNDLILFGKITEYSIEELNIAR